jgi:Fe-S cluster assembly scaffold protein SufB
MSEDTKVNEDAKILGDIGEYKYGFHDRDDNYVFKSQRGLSKEVVENISRMKGEPQWMLDFRLKALAHYLVRPMPTWGPDISNLDLDNIFYYVKPTEKSEKSWDDVPDDIKNTFDKLGIPEAERKFLAGVGAQYESEMVYHSILEHLEKQGVIFLSIEDGLKQYPDLFREYFGTVIPIEDNKFAALNSAVWSGGSFVYVPKNVKVDLPLQAYFRLNTANVGQFERTLIIVDEGASVHYVEGCFLAGARVRTRNGEKAIENIEVGNEVMTHQGRWRKVYHTQKRPYHGNIYNLRFYGDSGRELKVTAEHPLLVVRRERKSMRNKEFRPTWARADSVKESDYLVIPVPQPEAEFELAMAQENNSRNSPIREIRVEEFLAKNIPDWFAENPSGDLNVSPFSLDENFMYVPIKEITVEEQETEVFNFSVEEDESYVAEGVISHNCTAPQYTTNSFHSGVIEIIVKKGARSRYSTIQNWSTNVFNLVTQRAKVYANASHEWVDSNLGCLAEGSTVTTPAGIKAIEALEVGDQVLSYNEAEGKLCFRAVAAKRFSGRQPVHTVSIGERKLQVTANHPFYSYHYNPDNAKKSGRYRFGYVRADELKQAILPRTSLDFGTPHFLTMPTLETKFESMNQYANNLTMTRQRPSHMTIGEYTTDDLMWMFGYWIGDGDMAFKPAKTEDVIRFAHIGFSTPREDRAREKLMNVMTSVIDIEPSERPDGHHLAWNSKELVEFFKANGFYGKASSKRISEWIWSLPESQRLAFVAGYIDADGMVNAHGFHIRSVNRGLLEDVASLLVTLGITSRLHTEFSEPRKVTIMGVECTAHGSYRLSFLPEARLLPYISQQLQDKSLAQHSRQNQFRQTVGRSQLALGGDVEIVPVEVSPASQDAVPTWDIEVEGTGNFVSQGFIVHNSKLTMKYPSCYLMEPGAHGEMLSMAFAGAGQIQDAGSKMIHFAPNTTSKITSKSISKGGGRASYRGLVKVYKGAKGVKSNVVCDALLLDPKSRSDTYPTIEIDEDDVTIGHEASVSKVGEEQLFYLMSRGLTEEEATGMVVSGFIEPLVKELPMEYAVEMNRLIQLQMEGSIG